eukprot:2830215-Prymnesium_polylepis.1
MCIRDSDHYGPMGFRSKTRKACQPLGDDQRAALLGSVRGLDRTALRRAGIGLLDGNIGTLDAHEAHPVVCVAPTVYREGAFYDCRHFCQPGPIDLWNARLLEELEGSSGAASSQRTSGT